ncbi:FHA domain-containing protein [Pseudarthrobacter enclensis]|uniref:FHA domain-containing protein n=1 Tax=Pseudarthrobacter enclensis TaxID=993070 RepID=A0ABT9RMW6_9MICC|nr:FHA domain-containing protein [Pseudarthrobacter enclensis]MDP9886576.1 hypothetical protein [Pseudarthrobacter enclensis]
MTGASYTPGHWLGIIRSRTAVLLGPGAPAELAGALWELLAGRPEPHEVLAAVTSSSGGSLTRIPSFGILDFNGSLRVFLRGGIDLAVDQPGGAVELDGRDVTTWNERRFVVPGTCRLVIADSAGTIGQDAGQRGTPLTELPLGEGVVLLQSLTLGAPSGPAAVDRPAAAPTGVAEAPAAADGPFAVNTTGEVDGIGGEYVSGPSPQGVLRGQEASAETVGGTLDQDPADEDPDSGELGGGEPPGMDPDDERLAGADLQPASAAALMDPAPLIDPEATIAPGAIIDADGELVARAAGMEPADGVAAGHGTGMGEAVPSVELTSSYDHLWDRTVMRNIEDAAVREEPDPDSGRVPARQQPALPATEQRAAIETAQDAAPEEPATAAEGAVYGGTGQSAAAGTASAADAPARPRPASTGLIDSVPWRTGGSTPAASASAPAPPPAPGTPPAPAADAPVPADGGLGGPAQEAPPAEPGASFDPDHDGQTVMKNSLPGAGSGASATPPAGRPDASGAPLVLARVCSRGHANPPTHAQCSACGAALLPDAVQVARPRLGRMRLSTGELLDLDQSMVIGRQPSVSRVQGGVMPRLVQVASPGGDISRSHVEVRLEGWHVMLCDLKATNGTVLVREGQPPRRLAQNEMAILLDGDIAELGDDISLRFEEIP